MKFAFCVEDDTDEEVFRILVSRALGTEVVPSETSYRFPRGGWTKALRVAHRIARDAYNNGLDGVLFAIDNDGSTPLHSSSHSDLVPGCRLCELRGAARVHEPLSWPRPGLPALRYVFAVPVQVLETWLLLAQGHDFKGDSDLGRDATGRKKLKHLLYGMEQPDRDTMRRAALPIAQSLDMNALAKVSPSFADFLTQLR